MAEHDIWIEPFIAALAENSNISDVCRRLQIPRRTVYERKLKDPEFSKRLDEALAVATGMLEATAYSRAIDGWEEPVYFQGEECGRVRKFDNVLLMRMLAAHKPIYRQNSGVELSGSLQISSLSDEELNAEILRLQRTIANIDPPTDAADPTAELA